MQCTEVHVRAMWSPLAVLDTRMNAHHCPHERAPMRRQVMVMRTTSDQVGDPWSTWRSPLEDHVVLLEKHDINQTLESIGTHVGPLGIMCGTTKVTRDPPVAPTVSAQGTALAVASRNIKGVASEHTHWLPLSITMHTADNLKGPNVNCSLMQTWELTRRRPDT